MFYVIFGFKFDIIVKKIVWKMQYKPIENYHVENVVLGKDFNLDDWFLFSCFHPLILKF
jgi:hypothetical protein